MNNERENYSWGIIQDMIEREISSAFKLREPTKMPSKKEIKQIIKSTVQKERLGVIERGYEEGSSNV
jgi:hypothetical protein